MTGPVISIVIPSLNQAVYLEHALRSVVDQSYPHVELIVIDGGSTDGSVEIIARHAVRITSWSSQPDGGAASALNAGFRRATGEIFGFLNADDFYLPGALAAVADAFAASPDVDVLSGHGYFAAADGTLGAPMSSDRWDRTRFSYGACVLLQPATFFRRSAYERAGGFRESGRVCWDMELWADLARSGASFGALDRPVAAFRLHSESLTGKIVHREVRRRDARAVMAELRGRPESLTDQLGHLIFRALKFANHPMRSLRRRAYFLSTLGRWKL